jgi:hypothetical protein
LRPAQFFARLGQAFVQFRRVDFRQNVACLDSRADILAPAFDIAGDLRVD